MIPLQQFAAVSFSGRFGIMPTFLDAGTGAEEAPVSGTLQVPYPATVAAGNFLLAHVYANDSGAGGVTTPAGWTSINLMPATADVTKSRVFYKIADGTETGNLDVSVSADVFAIGRIYRFDRGSGVEAAAGSHAGASSVAMPAVDVTTLGANRVAVQAFGCKASSVTIGNLTGESGADYTEAVAEYSTSNGILSLQIASVSSATAITGGSVDMSGAGTERSRHGFAIIG